MVTVGSTIDVGSNDGKGSLTRRSSTVFGVEDAAAVALSVAVTADLSIPAGASSGVDVVTTGSGAGIVSGGVLERPQDHGAYQEP